MGRTTVPVDEQTADALAELKSRGDTYDDVIRRLLRDDYGTAAAEIVADRGDSE